MCTGIWSIGTIITLWLWWNYRTSLEWRRQCWVFFRSLGVHLCGNKFHIAIWKVESKHCNTVILKYLFCFLFSLAEMPAREYFSAWQAASSFPVNNMNPVLQTKAVHHFRKRSGPWRAQGTLAYKVCLEKILFPATCHILKLCKVCFPHLFLPSPKKWLLMRLILTNHCDLFPPLPVWRQKKIGH